MKLFDQIETSIPKICERLKKKFKNLTRNTEE